ncbi:hypothetical protein LV84_00031 [Algoriphagus ratkowskyi]|uniref:SPOR domain-containing protein n=1 Tax=Algoriphagus ratkowskyi TaxID=57028 RepID=A0A2W7RJN0_9BACT|nr:hypothetical protein [Algoriphagus ratkowskyi]PZX61043.1 hypothetical protein LV84_00031 [Algoriphagus ratkowskyi]TXD79179.1 hypothetical protein ESW18_02785 [Algoriphagus ratkowskyi]
MTDKTTDTKQWTDPADFGLPFVKVVPLNQATISKKEEKKVEPINVAEIKKKTIHAVKPIYSDTEEIAKPKPKIAAKKYNNSWIWIAALLALAVVLLIIWQMNQSVVSGFDPETVVAETSDASDSTDYPAAAINSTPSEETQITENQSAISDSASSDSPAPGIGQTGTTIASTVSGTLVRVTEKADRAQFYIIIGSLPNEAMALEEANKYMNRAETVYLILPYEDVTNYRLAIGTSRGWTAINEELARVKDQYTEDLWILKY